MPSITFAAMVDPIAPFAPGCPSLTLQYTARKIVKDLCQRANVWRATFAPIAIGAGVHEYTPSTGLSYGEAHDITDGYVVVNNVKTDVRWRSYDDVRRMSPAWPQDFSGTPNTVTGFIPQHILLAPVPDTAGTLTLMGTVRPKETDTEMDADVYSEHTRAIFHGVLSEILAMPNRSWTDAKGAMVHGKQWSYLLNAARDRAQRGYNSADLTVQMRPFA